MNATHNARLVSLMARTPTPALITALRTLEATARTPEISMVRAWTITELETRFPAASDVVEAAFEVAEESDPPAEVDYVAVLLAAIAA